MNYKLKAFGIILSVLFSSGCTGTPNRTLSPPADTQWVNVEVKNPSQYTKPFPLEVRYISHKCLKKRISGVDGSVITEPNYNVINIPLQQGANDLWKAKVAMTGGGACEWTLSAFNVGIEYIDAIHLGKDLVPGTAVGATIAFDDDASRNGKFSLTSGSKLNYTPKYYPFIIRWNEQKNSTTPDKLYLFGKENAFFETRLHIKPNEDSLINYRPDIQESKIVEMKFPYEKKKGSTYTYIYPNGEKVLTKDINPDFNKLEQMK
ncbi:hypothetical protein [Rahnella selenatireducens]|uniref:hypothetical protein n=1 Tax=Rahnella selenatireducens TaxID=3389797 RepID=UPI003968E6BD